jgi:tetratricopeptide (TPR) repeat protein/tRNA A-37 threonylcarbamoyl transferase component Bud32
MTIERWQRVKEIVAEGLERQGAARAQFLDAVCGSDPSLRAEVEDLIASFQSAGAFLDEAPVAVKDIAEAPSQSHHSLYCAKGEHIGPYRVLDVLGQGGMGTVYRALRVDEEFTMQVAVKVIKRGMDSEAVVRRFRRERQIMARLAHPNIARLLDGGVTDDGLLYFVMEFIEGQPLDAYCRNRAADTRERIRLFRDVCEAVQYAHRNLIVHGDIKPSNVLVTAEGTPKLLDFGVARFLDPDSPDVTATAGFRPMTPAYSSPEQLRGEGVTTLSDLYSLGAVLYELLAVQRPYKFEAATPAAVLRVLETSDPPKPSAVSGRLELEGDLDNIALKAIEKEPERRYGSVEQLSEDLRRHLAGLPVTARPDTILYRLTKFAGRNRVAVLASLLVTLSLVAAVVATSRQYAVARAEHERAERRFRDVRRLANTFMYDLDESLVDLPGGIEVRRKLVENSLRYLDSLAKESAGDVTLQRELASAYEKMGDILGRPSYSNLGQTAAALESYKKALAIREPLAKATPKDLQLQQELASIYSNLSAVLKVMGDYSGGLDYDRKALAMRLALVAAKPNDRVYRRHLASSFTTLGAGLSLLGDWAGVLEARAKALQMFEELVAADPGNVADRHSLELAHLRMGSILLHEGDRATALRHMNQALDIAKALYAERPNDARIRMAFARVHATIGAAHLEGKNPAVALEHFSKAAEIHETLVALEPQDARSRSLLATDHIRMGLALARLGKAAAAIEHIKVAIPQRESLAQANPANAGARAEVAEGYAAMGEALGSAGRRGEAAEWYRRSLVLFEELDSRKLLNASTVKALEQVRREAARLEGSHAAAKIDSRK